MAILGISSATNVISVGLCQDGQVLAEMSSSGKQAFTEDLVPYIDRVVKTQFIASLTGISIVQGPGAYSGLRGGMAVAKTLAQTLKLPIVGVSTLETIAYNLIDSQGTFAVMTDARRQEFNFALFTVKDQVLTRLTEDLVLESAQIIRKLAQIKGKIILAGTVEDIFEELKAVTSETKIITCDPIHSYPKGSVAAILGEKLLASGKSEDFLKLVPKYSHKPVLKEWSKGRKK